MRNRLTAMTGVFLFVFAFSFGLGASLLDVSSAGACCPPCNCSPCPRGGEGYSHLGGPCQDHVCHAGPLCQCFDYCGVPEGPG
jgi:hypothetical protein